MKRERFFFFFFPKNFFWKTYLHSLQMGEGHYTQLVKAATYRYIEESVRISYSLADQNQRLPSLKMENLRVTHAVLSTSLLAAPRALRDLGLREA